MIAGPRQGKRFVNSVTVLQKRGTWQPPQPTSTAIGVVATSARLDREGVNKLAQMAHDGLARAIRPCHTLVDGDVMFALSMGNKGKLADVTALGAVAAEVVAAAVVRGVMLAEGLGGIPSAKEFKAALGARI